MSNILKVRDDREPIEFSANDGEYLLENGVSASWASDNKFTIQELRDRVEPWLTALFQSEHLSLLTGTGLTIATAKIAAPERETTTLANISFEGLSDEIKEKVVASAKDSAERNGRGISNIEDSIRVANELLRGMEVLGHESVDSVRKAIANTLRKLADSVLQDEVAIATANEQTREVAFNTIVTFLMSFASRTGTRDRLQIFTTNYDRVIEAGAEVAGLHLLDRFVGNLSPIFRSSRLQLDLHYNPPGIRGEPRFLEGVARFTKLHGSLDWVQTDRNIRRVGLPFGAPNIEPYLKIPGFPDVGAHELMIFPNSAKDRDTAAYPYVDLFRDFAAAICRPNNTLVTYGYSFGDDHINRVIGDMLTIPSTHLVIIALGDDGDRIMNFYRAIGRATQISLLIGRELADIEKLTTYFLPKASIDRTTFRMGELLKQRFGTKQMAATANSDSATASEGIS